MTSILTYQPFKGIYALLAIGFELTRMPIWVVKYITTYGRQHPLWSFKQACGTRLLYAFLHHSSIIQVYEPLPLTPGAEKERFITIPPASAKLYKGPLVHGDVKPATIGATWYPAPLTSTSDKSSLTVVLHMHGGAFVAGDGRTATAGYLANKFLKHGGITHVLLPQYRLSTLPASKTSNPFPAALQDTLTSYLYLLNDLKIPASNIIVSGDSAGGNLALALLRYLSQYGSDLDIPTPGGAWLWSPWVQPSGGLDMDTFLRNPNFNTDYLPPSFITWGVKAYAGLAGPSSLSSPYISHLGLPFATATPIYLNTGGAEVLCGDDVQCGQEMKGVAGNRVVVDVEEAVPHDIVLTGQFNAFHDEAAHCVKRAGEWWKGVKAA